MYNKWPLSCPSLQEEMNELLEGTSKDENQKVLQQLERTFSDITQSLTELKVTIGQCLKKKDKDLLGEVIQDLANLWFMQRTEEGGEEISLHEILIEHLWPMLKSFPLNALAHEDDSTWKLLKKLKRELDPSFRVDICAFLFRQVISRYCC